LDIADLLEARYHLHALSDLAQIHSVSGEVILQLDTWGAWEWEDRLLRETLTWMPGGSAEAAAALHQLGIVAQNRGDYDAALDWYRKSLAIREQLGDRAGMASSYHHLGIVAQDRGHYDAALDWYRKSLAIKEQLGDRAGMASTLSNIGILYTQTGRASDAVPLNLQSLALRLQRCRRGSGWNWRVA
jgi:tetratricopeptide (TPR) repeat protein